MEINYIGYSQTIQKVKKPKSCFFKNINKTDKNLARLTF